MMMDKKEMKKLATEVVRFIRPTPGCDTCGKEPTQMCGKCFGRIRHKLPLTEDQQLMIRDIEYEAKKQIHKRRIFINSLNLVWFVFLFFGSLLYMKYLSGMTKSILFGFIFPIILHVFSYFLLFLTFCQAVSLSILKKQIKYNRTIEDENYY